MKMFALLSLCALGCSTSGNPGQPGQQPPGFAGLFARALPPPAQQAQPQQPAPMQPPAMQPPAMQPPAMQPPDPEAFEQAEAPPIAPVPAPVEMAPVQPATPAAQGEADVCSAMCDRVAACQIATKEACMPACAPHVPQLTAEQRAQVIAMMGSMACEDMSQFGAQAGSGSGAPQPMAPEGSGSDDDGQDS